MNTYQFWSDNVTHARNALKAERDKIDQLIPQMDLNAELDAMDSSCSDKIDQLIPQMDLNAELDAMDS